MNAATCFKNVGRTVLACASLWTALAAADSVDLEVINRVIDEGYNRSEVPLTAAQLTDVIGPRLTNSPQARAAEKWTQQQFAHWGLKKVRAEAVAFGRGWSIENYHVRMTSPRVVIHQAIPVAWTPGTNGVLSAPIVVAPLERERDFERWRGQLRGKIVLISQPDAAPELTEPMFRRLDAGDLSKLDVHRQPPTPDPKLLRDRLRERLFEFTRDAFLAEQGAVAWVRKSAYDGGMIQGVGYGFAEGRTPRLPGFEIAAEHYRQVARLAKTGVVPVLEVSSAVRYHDEDPNAYNILAEIPGRDAAAGYVMAGAHLDSWVASDGAADNAAGSVIVMEAARILSKLGVRPKRSIRFVLWAAEEQGLLGSLSYVERYLARRKPLADPEQARLMPHLTWNTRWPITPGPEYGALGAYFNFDNGSGKVRGIHAEGNVAMMPLLRQWLAPFASMGATMVAASPTYGTDHMLMSAVGLSAFQFIQDPLDYATRISHSNIDSYDHLSIPDLKQASVVLASMLLQAADHPGALPRKPMPVQPAAVDPFEYGDPIE